MLGSQGVQRESGKNVGVQLVIVNDYGRTDSQNEKGSCMDRGG
jgi:hypothetical protein